MRSSNASRDEPRLAACGPRLLNLDGSDYPSARTFPSVPIAIGHGLLGLWWPRNPFTVRYRQLDADPAAPRIVDWVSGAAVWLRRSALDEVGGWDERYFMYLEDTDLCWRLRRAGWEVAYEPSAVVVHAQGVERVAPALPDAPRASPLRVAVCEDAPDRPARRAAPVRRRLLRSARGAGDGRARVAFLPSVEIARPGRRSGGRMNDRRANLPAVSNALAV